MSLDVWYKDDVKNALVALNEANGALLARLNASLGAVADVQAYRDGYCDALHAVAVALGIEMPGALPEPLTVNLPKIRNWKEVNTIVGTESD
jgi:hypothetical protein